MDYFSAALIVGGMVFFAGGSVGIIRFPDFYSRLHPGGMLDSMGLFLSLSGMALYLLHDFSINALLNCLKIVLILVFVFMTSPTATHAIVDAGVRAGLDPWTKDQEDEENL